MTLEQESRGDDDMLADAPELRGSQPDDDGPVDMIGLDDDASLTALARLAAEKDGLADELDNMDEPEDEDLALEVELETKEEEREKKKKQAHNGQQDPRDHLANIDGRDTIGIYLKEVAQTPLLTADEEVALAKRVESGRDAREEMVKGNASARRKAELRVAIEDAGVAQDHLIRANGRLVISIAKKYMGRGVPFLDLIQEGNIGLIRSSKKFDWRRGHKFSTYATWWIRQAVTRSIADQGRTIRIPVHMGDTINRILRAQHELTQRLGRDPTTEELAFAVGKTTEKLENILKAARRPISLETPTGDDDDSELGDFIEDENEPTDETATYDLLREHLAEVLATLRPREVRILQLRYGLLDGQAYTLDEVGKKMGVTRERVRQIQNEALSKLRHPGIRRKLRDYLGE
jgi:RNA polymerase primary sigma factor